MLCPGSAPAGLADSIRAPRADHPAVGSDTSSRGVAVRERDRAPSPGHGQRPTFAPIGRDGAAEQQPDQRERVGAGLRRTGVGGAGVTDGARVDVLAGRHPVLRAGRSPSPRRRFADGRSTVTIAPRTPRSRARERARNPRPAAPLPTPAPHPRGAARGGAGNPPPPRPPPPPPPASTEGRSKPPPRPPHPALWQHQPCAGSTPTLPDGCASR